MMNLNPYT